MKQIYIPWRQMEKMTTRIGIDILRGDWRPSFIVGINRGGLTPAVMLSHLLNVPLYTLRVSLRDGVEDDCDHNLWMSERAYGYGQTDCLEDLPENILIVDDINNSGATFEWIQKDWRSSCLPNSPEWDKVWHNNVKFAVLVNNLASNQTADFSAMEINKAEEPSWVTFPWEYE